LRGVALNLYRNWSRGRRRQKTVTLSPALLEQAAQETEPAEAERIERLRAAIERLPARQREVVLMHYLEETSVKEVAALLGVPAKTVEGRLF
ncbi:RNA polymerase sigma factor, partial [Vibrio cholerae]|uniref:RNA polymerase sigma factor n=1 Tax=Vibrio cholerae TaxID=666 RepID=UPI00301D3944